MERWMGPVLAGAAACSLSLWALYADARRMGFHRPRSPAEAVAKGAKGQGWSTRVWRKVVVAALVLGVWHVRPLWAYVVALVALALQYVRGHKRDRRRAELKREWPFLIESMAVAALSGMEPGAAFQSAAKRTRGALKEETERVLLRLAGGASLSKALSSITDKSLPGVRRLRTLLAQSEILGTPVAGMIKRLADEGYEEERNELEERFNALPLKLSAITVFFLLPPVLAVSVIPHVLAFLEARW